MASSSTRQASSAIQPLVEQDPNHPIEYNDELDFLDDNNSYNKSKLCLYRQYEHIRYLKDKPNSDFEILFKFMDDTMLKGFFK